MTRNCSSVRALLAERVGEREDDERQPHDRRRRADRMRVAALERRPGERPEELRAGAIGRLTGGRIAVFRRPAVIAPRPADGAGTAASGRPRPPSRSPASRTSWPLMPAPTVRGSKAYWSPSASARIGKILAMSISVFGIPSGGNQMLEMNVNGRITRFTTTGRGLGVGDESGDPDPERGERGRSEHQREQQTGDRRGPHVDAVGERPEREHEHGHHQHDHERRADPRRDVRPPRAAACPACA